MLTFFLKVQHTQRGYHRGLSSLMDKPLVPKMRRLRVTKEVATGKTGE
jgi:hypothetical protein